MRYVRPKSLTWWAGLASVATGGATMALPQEAMLGELGRLLAMFAGSADASPAALVFLGLGLIGLRDRLERSFRGEG